MTSGTARRLEWLDVLRAVAAAVVVFGHYADLFFEDYHGQGGALAWLFYFVRGFGRQAVIVFFVLSGYFVGGSVLGAQRRGAWSWRDYAMQRLPRMYTVVLPCLALTLLCDWAGMSLLHADALYGGHGDNTVLQFDVASRHGAATLLGNLFFLQHLIVPPLGSNTPLWTLSLELWYYVLFPALVVTVSAGRSRAVRCMHGVLAVAVMLLLGVGPLLLFLPWLAGVGVALLAPRTRVDGAPRPRHRVALGAAMFSLTLLLARSHVLPLELADLVLGLGTAALITPLVRAQPRMPTELARIARLGGELSFSAYAFHVPLLVLFFAARAQRQMTVDTLHMMMALLHLLGLTLVLGALWWLFERRTEDVRRALAGRPVLRTDIAVTRPPDEPSFPSTK